LNPPQKKVDWETAKKCLAELQRLAPDILRQSVLIGGIACWFYRTQLEAADDPDFRVPLLSAAEENVWLSKDIDFTNFFIDDARQLLSQHLRKDAAGRVFIEIAGVPVGFAQVGVTFDPEVAWVDAWIGSFESEGLQIEFRVLDPVSLYREKQALSQKRRSESDLLHLAVVTEFLRWETLREIAALEVAQRFEERTFPVKFLTEMRDRAPELFRDSRMQARLGKLAAAPLFPPGERKLIKELLALGEN
jgi:hypothetical protein